MCASHWVQNETHRRNESEERSRASSHEGARRAAAEGGRAGARVVVRETGRRRRVSRPRTPGASQVSIRDGAHQERTRWDPKDGELCLVRTKSGETLMEVRSDSDVQIDRRNWV